MNKPIYLIVSKDDAYISESLYCETYETLFYISSKCLEKSKKEIIKLLSDMPIDISYRLIDNIKSSLIKYYT